MGIGKADTSMHCQPPKAVQVWYWKQFSTTHLGHLRRGALVVCSSLSIGAVSCVAFQASVVEKYGTTLKATRLLVA